MLIRITPDKEKAKSMFNLVKSRESFILTIDINQFATIALETYYEIIKELSSIIALLEGLKATGENAHKDLIDYMSNHKEFDEEEIFLMDDLRIKRNKSSYEGKQIEPSYLENRKAKILKIIEKLNNIIKTKI